MSWSWSGCDVRIDFQQNDGAACRPHIIPSYFHPFAIYSSLTSMPMQQASIIASMLTHE